METKQYFMNRNYSIYKVNLWFAIITGVLGDKHYLIIGLLAISVPIVIDVITKRYHFSMFRRVFLGSK